MKLRLFATASILVLSFVVPARTQTPCKPFRVSDVVERMVFDTPTGKVLFFDLRFFIPRMVFNPPDARYFKILRKGSRVVVAGRQCGDEYFVDSVRRGR